MSNTNLEKCPKCGKEYHSDGSSIIIQKCNRCDEIYCEYCNGGYNHITGHVCYDGVRTMHSSIYGFTKPKSKRKTDGWW